MNPAVIIDSAIEGKEKQQNACQTEEVEEPLPKNDASSPFGAEEMNQEPYESDGNTNKKKNHKYFCQRKGKNARNGISNLGEKCIGM